MPKDVPPQISEDDREAAVRRLQDAFAEGHISHAEMDHHLQASAGQRHQPSPQPPGTSESPAQAMKLLAEASTSLARIKASKRLYRLPVASWGILFSCSPGW